ncbi:MAG TPA: PEP-CTERM sorting domain-containing protein [Luteolibacter sp.]|nr:PEP-CTERM sorting domain-containing protein [Luteolibacter sp.]
MKRRHHSLIAIAAGLLTISTGYSAVLLQDYTLGGVQQKVSWESVEAGGTIGTGGALSTANATNTPTSGVGTVGVNAPGFKASSGFYSFSTNFSMTASTSIQGNAFDDIQNVVFQRTSIDTGAENLTLGGGPLLSYFIDGSSTAAGTLVASYFGLGAATIPNSQGNYYAFTYQWDLSGVVGNITSISITAPIPVHSSTVEAQIDISGGGFTQVIPEPASMALSALGFAGLFIRRRR